MLNYLPFLFFAVLMATMGVICRRYLRRVKAAYAKHGLTMPDPTAPTPGAAEGAHGSSINRNPTIRRNWRRRCG